MVLFAVEEFKEKKRNGAVRCRRIQRKEKKTRFCFKKKKKHQTNNGTTNNGTTNN